MKKILALLLVMVMLFTLAACDKNTGGDTSGTEEPSGTEDPNVTEPPTGGTEDSTNPPDNSNGENTDTFVATPTKYTKDAFIAKIVAYTQNNNSNESQFVEISGGEDDLRGENGYYLDKWHIMSFSEGHDFNLFLYTLNALADQSESWVDIEKQNNEYTGDVSYTVKISYEISCDSLSTAIALAKDDAYRLPSFFEITPSEVYFSLVAKGTNKATKVSALTDNDLTKLANGDYQYISALRSAGNRGGVTCSTKIQIQKATDGQYLYNSEFNLKFSG